MADWGVLFDWDGVIVDSSAAHEESWERLAAEEKKSLPPDHFKKGFGRKNEYIIPHQLGWTQDEAEIRRLSLRKEELYRQVVREKGLDPLPGVRTFVKSLRDAGVPFAIASSTHRENILSVLEIIGLEKSFQFLVSSEDVNLGKPDPEVFLVAAGKIGQEPGHCLVFEDTQAGIEAGLSGGMKVVALTTSHPADTLGAAHTVLDRMDEWSLEQYRDLIYRD